MAHEVKDEEVGRSNEELLWLYATDILSSPGMEKSRAFNHHAGISTYEHSCLVARICLVLSDMLPFPIDRYRLVRGALLHDYFLYDWHAPGERYRFHNFTHPKKALKNARRDFCVTDIEEDMILRHMFPLTPFPPRTTEGKILCLADKICAIYEVGLGNLRRIRKVCAKMISVEK